MTLAEAARKHNCTKLNMGYIPIYERVLAPFRRMAVTTLLEIGVRGGNSLRMWREWLGVFTTFVLGTDIDPNCKAQEDVNELIFIAVGDQNDRRHLRSMAGAAPFDIIVDDGSHVNEHIVKTFCTLWPVLEFGGVYAIEDLQCSYLDLDSYGVRDKWPGMQHNAPGPLRNDRSDIVRMLRWLSWAVDHGRCMVESVEIHRRLIVIRKGGVV